MQLVPPANENMAKGLTHAGQERYNYLKNGAEAMLAKHPELDSGIITQYLQEFIEAETANTAALKNFDAENERRLASKKANPGSVSAENRVLSTNAMASEIQASRKAFEYQFYVRHVEKADEKTKATWKAYTDHMRGPSIVGGVFKQFYDNDKEGVNIAGFKPGGIIGAILGGIVGYNLMGASGGMWAIALAAVATLAGAWVGNYATELVGGMFKKSDAEPAAAPKIPAKAKSQEQTTERPASELSPEQMEAAKKAAANTPGSGTMVDAPGGNSAPNAPAMAKPKAQQQGQPKNSVANQSPASPAP